MTSEIKHYTPGPWQVDQGTIRSQAGDVLGNYPFTVGDQTDRNNGELMAKAPELLEAASLAIRTINDTIRHENLKPGNEEALANAAKGLYRLIAGWQPAKPGGSHE